VEQLFESAFHGFLSCGGFYGSQFFTSVGLAAYLREDAEGFLLVPRRGQPARAFGQDETEDEEKGCGYDHGPEHPPPSHLSVPRQAYHFGCGVVGHRFGNLPVDDLCAKDSQYYRQLVDGHETSAQVGRGDFRYIHRRKARSDADGESADEAEHVEQSERVGGTRAHGRTDE
jgi:hypothetical protein